MNQESQLLANEFASVRVEIDRTANGPRLKLTDVSSGVHAYLDPLELQCLAWLDHDDLVGLMDPDFVHRTRRGRPGSASGRAVVAAAEEMLRHGGDDV